MTTGGRRFGFVVVTGLIVAGIAVFLTWWFTQADDGRVDTDLSAQLDATTRNETPRRTERVTAKPSSANSLGGASDDTPFATSEPSDALFVDVHIVEAHTRRPVPGARVWLLDTTPEMIGTIGDYVADVEEVSDHGVVRRDGHRAVTDAMGTARLPWRGGRVVLWAEADDAVADDIVFRDPRESPAGAPLVLEVEPARSVRVRVVDDNEQICPGVPLVLLYAADHDGVVSRYSRFDARATDDDGIVSFHIPSAAPDARFLVTFAFPCLEAPESSFIAARPPAGIQTLKLPPLGAVNFRWPKSLDAAIRRGAFGFVWAPGHHSISNVKYSVASARLDADRQVSHRWIGLGLDLMYDVDFRDERLTGRRGEVRGPSRRGEVVTIDLGEDIDVVRVTFRVVPPSGSTMPTKVMVAVGWNGEVDFDEASVIPLDIDGRGEIPVDRHDADVGVAELGVRRIPATAATALRRLEGRTSFAGLDRDVDAGDVRLLVATPTVAGRVVDEHGAPVAEARVWIAADVTNSAISDPEEGEFVVANALGRFAVFAPPPVENEAFVVVADARGHGRGATKSPVSTGTTDVVVRVPEGFDVVVPLLLDDHVSVDWIHVDMIGAAAENVSGVVTDSAAERRGRLLSGPRASWRGLGRGRVSIVAVAAWDPSYVIARLDDFQIPTSTPTLDLRGRIPVVDLVVRDRRDRPVAATGSTASRHPFFADRFGRLRLPREATRAGITLRATDCRDRHLPGPIASGTVYMDQAFHVDVTIRNFKPAGKLGHLRITLSHFRTIADKEYPTTLIDSAYVSSDGRVTLRTPTTGRFVVVSHPCRLTETGSAWNSLIRSPTNDFQTVTVKEDGATVTVDASRLPR